ncbi:hypothetical protein L7F22_008985 [Adiantum nelumboides]|nr:hypothetical protein [Adiantum nelumboides]
MQQFTGDIADIFLNSEFTLLEELFVEAASSGDVQKTNALIPVLLNLEGFDITIFSSDSLRFRAMCYHALQSAAENGHAKIVKEVLILVSNASSWFNFSRSAVGKFKSLEGTMAPLWAASMYEWNVDDSARVFSSPLHLAVKEGHRSVVEEIISFFVSKKQDFTDFFTNKEVHGRGIIRRWFQGLMEWAIRWGHAPVIEILLTQQPLLDLCYPAGPVFDIVSPLHLAAYHNHQEILHLILESNIGFEVSLIDIKQGLTALHLSALFASREVVNFLLNFTPLKLNSRSYPELFTALHVAADFGNLEVVQLLLQTALKSRRDNVEETEWDADVLMARDCMGRTALHYAARQGHEAIVEELLKCSSLGMQQGSICSIANVVDHDGLLALHMAARSGHAGVIEKLIRMPYASMYNINQKAKQSRHVKDWVEKEFMKRAPCTMYHGEMYRYPRPKLFDSMFFQTQGFTPLHFAARYGHEAALRTLLTAKAGSCIDLHVTDERGFSAYDWMKVREEGHIFLNCLEEIDVSEGRHSSKELVALLKQSASLGHKMRRRISKNMLRQIALDIIEEKEAMEDIREASCSYAGSGGCGRPLRLNTAIVRWLEEKEPCGRVISWWLPWAVREGDLELVKSLLGSVNEAGDFNVDARTGDEEYRQIAYKVVDDTVLDIVRSGGYKHCHEGILIELLLMHLPVGTIRAAATCKALCTALEFHNFIIARKIVLLEQEAVVTHELLKVVMAVKDVIYNDLTRCCKEGAGHFLMALMQRSGILPLSFLRELLTLSLKEPNLRECGVMQVILERGEVKKGLYEDRQVYLDCANAMLVGAALIAGLAFEGWLQPPLGYNYEFEGGLYAEVHKWAVRLFWRFNNGAFFLAVGALITGAKGAVPAANEVDLIGSVEKGKRAVVVSSTLLGMALVCVMVAFTMAQLAVIPPLASDMHMVHTSVAWGAAVCGFTLLWFSVSVLPLILTLFSYILSSVLYWLQFIAGCVVFMHGKVLDCLVFLGDHLIITVKATIARLTSKVDAGNGNKEHRQIAYNVVDDTVNTVRSGTYEHCHDCANAMFVGAALIARLAFQGGLEPPLHYYNEFEGEDYRGAQASGADVLALQQWNVLLSSGNLDSRSHGSVIADRIESIGEGQEGGSGGQHTSGHDTAFTILAQLAVIPSPLFRHAHGAHMHCHCRLWPCIAPVLCQRPTLLLSISSYVLPLLLL